MIPGEEFSTTIASAGGRLFQLIRTIGWREEREDLNRLMNMLKCVQTVAGLLYIAVIEAKDSKDCEDTVVTDLPIAAEKAEERFFSPLSKSLLMLERETNQSASI